MKIIVTTSNSYSHILPIFCYLFTKFWNHDDYVEIVGYKKPDIVLPENMTFVSMGEQVGDNRNFTRDLRVHFAKQDQFFIWLMEDTFLIRNVDFFGLEFLKRLTLREDIGRINLTGECVKQTHVPYEIVDGVQVYENTPDSIYRLSTQPSIWNRDFVLANMQNDLSPWEFECQSDLARDKYHILGLDKENAPIRHNEGVRKRDIFAYNFAGLDQSIIDDMKQKGVI